jgi:hypothetical protein
MLLSVTLSAILQHLKFDSAMTPHYRDLWIFQLQFSRFPTLVVLSSSVPEDRFVHYHRFVPSNDLTLHVDQKSGTTFFSGKRSDGKYIYNRTVINKSEGYVFFLPKMAQYTDSGHGMP